MSNIFSEQYTNKNPVYCLIYDWISNSSKQQNPIPSFTQFYDLNKHVLKLSSNFKNLIEQLKLIDSACSYKSFINFIRHYPILNIINTNVNTLCYYVKDELFHIKMSDGKSTSTITFKDDLLMNYSICWNGDNSVDTGTFSSSSDLNKSYKISRLFNLFLDNPFCGTNEISRSQLKHCFLNGQFKDDHFNSFKDYVMSGDFEILLLSKYFYINHILRNTDLCKYIMLNFPGYFLHYKNIEQVSFKVYVTLIEIVDTLSAKDFNSFILLKRVDVLSLLNKIDKLDDFSICVFKKMENDILVKNIDPIDSLTLPTEFVTNNTSDYIENSPLKSIFM